MKIQIILVQPLQRLLPCQQLSSSSEDNALYQGLARLESILFQIHKTF